MKQSLIQLLIQNLSTAVLSLSIGIFATIVHSPLFLPMEVGGRSPAILSCFQCAAVATTGREQHCFSLWPIANPLRRVLRKDFRFLGRAFPPRKSGLFS